MIKNITVLSHDRTVIGTTYPKRAKGLVKKGRARFVDEQTLQLIACPPNVHSEDHMNNTIDINNTEIQNTRPAETEQKPTETATALPAIRQEAQPLPNPEPEKVRVHLEIFKTGMEIWKNEVQILLCPILKNGRNAIALHSTDVTFSLSVFDRDDNEKKLQLKPSTIYEGGHLRGLSIIRFTPCIADADNVWIPSRLSEYWISFKAIGTDGKLYVSDEAKIVLNGCPVIHGQLICAHSAGKMSFGNTTETGNFADMAEHISDAFGSFSERQLSSLQKELSEMLDDLDEPEEIEDALEEMLSEVQLACKFESGELKNFIQEAHDRLQDRIEEIRAQITDLYEDALDEQEEREAEQD